MKHVDNRPPSSSFVLIGSRMLCGPFHCFIWPWILYPTEEISSFCSRLLCTLEVIIVVKWAVPMLAFFQRVDWLHNSWSDRLSDSELLIVVCRSYSLTAAQTPAGGCIPSFPRLYAGFDGRWAAILLPKTFTLTILTTRIIECVLTEEMGLE